MRASADDDITDDTMTQEGSGSVVAKLLAVSAHVHRLALQFVK